MRNWRPTSFFQEGVRLSVLINRIRERGGIILGILLISPLMSQRWVLACVFQSGPTATLLIHVSVNRVYTRAGLTPISGSQPATGKGRRWAFCETQFSFLLMGVGANLERHNGSICGIRM